MKIRVYAFALWLAVASSAFAETNRNYEGVKAELQKIAAEHRGVVSLFELGPSDSGQKILGLKVGSGAVHTLVVSTHHGNEYGSTEVALGFAADLAGKPISGQTVYVIPVLNIGGYNDRNREELTGAGDSQDPNRDYPGPCGTEGPFKLKSTKALAEFVEHEKIVTSATLHTFYPAVVYPWGFSTQDLETAYPEAFRKLVTDATEESRYQIGNSAQVIYPANGCYEDWAFWKLGIWSILFELGSTHTPNDAELQLMVAQNVPGLRRMLENAPLQLAANHAFTGKCDLTSRSRDRHDE
jgi:carboxypeptidase T